MNQALLVSQKAACALELIKILLGFVRFAFSVETQEWDLQKPVCLNLMAVCFELRMPFISAVSSSPYLLRFCVN